MIIPRIGEIVEFPFKIERLAQRGGTKTLSKKIVVTRGMGKIISSINHGRVSVKLLACKKIRSKSWVSAVDVLHRILELAVDDLD